MNIETIIEQLSSEHTDKCLVVTDNQLDSPHPCILWVNNKFEELTGYTLEELKGKSPRTIQGEKTDRKTLDRIKKTLKDGGIFEGSILNYKKDGTEFTKAWRIVPIKDENESILYYLAVHQEVKIIGDYDEVMNDIIKIQDSILKKLDKMIH